MTAYKYNEADAQPWLTYTDEKSGKTVEPATETPAMDGTAAVGSSEKYAREDHVHPTDTSRAASTHTHGSITNAGAITSDTAVANGDKLIIADSSDSSKLKRSSVSFGSSTTTFLRNDGTWQTPSSGRSWVDISSQFSANVENITIFAMTDGTLVYLTAANTFLVEGFTTITFSSDYSPADGCLPLGIGQNTDDEVIIVLVDTDAIYEQNSSELQNVTAIWIT